MKTFKLESVDFPEHNRNFTERDPPAWLIHPENKWYYEKYILKLEIGDTFETDFSMITRTA